MIKKFFLGIAIISMVSQTAFAEDAEKIEARPSSIMLYSPQAKIQLKTSKIARIYGTINADSLAILKQDFKETAHIKGDRVILINSFGGEVTSGALMLAEMKKEQDAGTRMVCFVSGSAYSMAFNILTRCDVRIMAPRAMALAHKIANSAIPQRATPKMLRKIADELERDDEPYRQANSKAMNVTLEKYDFYCDIENYFRAETLLDMGYLHGMGIIKK